MPVATPAALIAAVPESEEAHCAEDVRSFELPSEYLPVALKETCADTETDVALGVTEMEDKTIPDPAVPVPPVEVLPPQAARIKESEIITQTAFVRRTVILGFRPGLFVAALMLRERSRFKSQYPVGSNGLDRFQAIRHPAA
jgi:hypothetical protein